MVKFEIFKSKTTTKTEVITITGFKGCTTARMVEQPKDIGVVAFHTSLSSKFGTDVLISHLRSSTKQEKVLKMLVSNRTNAKIFHMFSF